MKVVHANLQVIQCVFRDGRLFHRLFSNENPHAVNDWRSVMSMFMDSAKILVSHTLQKLYVPLFQQLASLFLHNQSPVTCEANVKCLTAMLAYPSHEGGLFNRPCLNEHFVLIPTPFWCILEGIMLKINCHCDPLLSITKL
jgi:hypothetical protein